MIYYKIIKDGKVVAVGQSADMRKHQQKHNIFLKCSESDAQFIQIGGVVYRDSWMKTIPDGVLVDFEEAEIVGIPEDEYKMLSEAIAKNEEVSAELEEYAVEEPEEVEEQEDLENYSLDYIKEVKIREMQLACTKAITEGFGLEMSDKKVHRFSLTIQDQMNLNSIFMQILSGAAEFPYHADGEEEKMYSAEEMSQIINAANTHKVYHLARFNSLKQWINALRKATTVSAVEYDSKIPEKYQSAYLKKLSDGNN